MGGIVKGYPNILSGPADTKDVTATVVPGLNGANKNASDVFVQGNIIYNEITDTVSSQKSFIGKTIGNITDTSLAQWQISQIVKVGSEVKTEYANNGAFDQIWDDRATLFPAPPFFNSGSLLFDGVDEYIDLGDNYDFGPAQAFTWSFWFKASNFAAQRAFIAKTTVDANVFGYSFQHNSSGKLYTQIRASGTLRAHTFNTIMTAGTWYHVSFTYAGGSNMNGLTAYINAVAETSLPNQSLNDWSNASPLRFGQRGSTFHYAGNLNQITVWDKELSSTEVTELYNAGSPNDPTSHSASANLVSYWSLDSDANFNTEVDKIASVDGTLTNMEIGDYIAGDVP